MDVTSDDTFSRPLADAIQYKAVQNFLDAGKNSATISLGGPSDKTEGYYVNPTIFTDVADDAKINVEEIFGPVAVVHAFKDAKEVLKRANDSEYGLFGRSYLEAVLHLDISLTLHHLASVFTKDINKAINFAKYLEAGVSSAEKLRTKCVGRNVLSRTILSQNVAVNCSSPMGASDMEFGGVKQSGIGREGGPRSLENWLETKSVYVAINSL